MSAPTLLAIAHGSRLDSAVTATQDIARSAARIAGAPFADAYLDLAEPSVQARAAELAANQCPGAIAVPLLFTEAFHATSDVPAALNEAQAATGLPIHLAGIIGTGDDVLAVLAEQARAHTAQGQEHSPVVLLAVGSSRPEANAAVSDLAGRLGDVLGRRVQAGFATCAPRAADMITADEPGLLLPLFTAPGLLLERTAASAAAAGWDTAGHLGAALGPLVAQRYLDCTAALSAD